MPKLITVSDLRERFDIDSDIGEKRIEPHIAAACRRLKGWVGAENYDAAADPTNNEGVDRDLVDDLKNAAAHLTMHFAIVGFNSPLSAKGVVATATAAEGKEVRRYLTPKETAELATQYLELAREIAGPWIAESDAAAAVLIGSSECCLPNTSCEGVTRSRC